MPTFLVRDLWDDWLNPAPLTVKGDSAASKRNRTSLLLALEGSSPAVASTIPTHVVDSKINNTSTVDPTRLGQHPLDRDDAQPTSGDDPTTVSTTRAPGRDGVPRLLRAVDLALHRQSSRQLAASSFWVLTSSRLQDTFSCHPLR